MPYPDINDLKEIFRTALVVNNDLMDAVADVVNGMVPDKIVDPNDPTVYIEYDWDKPILEYGIQIDVDDPRNSYAEQGLYVEMRLMAHDRGDRPGLLDYDACHDVLRLAHIALEDMPRTFNGWKVWRFRRARGIPETPELNPETYIHVSVGALYEIRITTAA